MQGALIAGLLAIIAGIFGMHVMTGNHGSHANQASAFSAGHVHAEALDHVHVEALPAAAGHEAAGHEAAGHSEHSDAGTPVADISSCGGSCHSMQESGAACIPSAKTGSLTVFPPPETGVSFNAGRDTRSGPAAAYAFTPSGRTPGELSISRT